MYDLLSMTREEMEAISVEAGFPAYRGRQLFSWCHEKECRDFDAMSSLPRDYIGWLRQQAAFTPVQIMTERVSGDGETVKFLLRFEGETFIETVLMLYRQDGAKDRNTVCVSTQAGCAMGCLFCASGKEGLNRQLTAGEIVSQVYAANAFLAARGEPAVSNLVYMGMGEPLANLKNVLQSMDILHQGKNIGWRRMTLSTCGLIPGIESLAKQDRQITLAVSLHAATDSLRSRLMPINKKYPLQPLFEALDRYIAATNRRVSLEYALFDHVNDGRDEAERLSKLVRGRLMHVNLIAGNDIDQADLSPSPLERTRRFMNILTDRGVEVSLRRSRGEDIEGACGQLRAAWDKAH